MLRERAASRLRMRPRACTGGLLGCRRHRHLAGVREQPVGRPAACASSQFGRVFRPAPQRARASPARGRVRAPSAARAAAFGRHRRVSPA
eukprot:2068439-Pleurochrysis_carterae.AAC.7